MEWLRYSKSEAAEKLANLENGQYEILNENGRNLQERLQSAAQNIKNNLQKNDTRQHYPFELRFAIELYSILDDEEFTLWEASDNEVWAYLSIAVIPDLVLERCNGCNANRFYKRNWRIWLKMLWWYIYLSMAVDEHGKIDKDKTFEILRDNTSDNINVLLDRSGTGFRVEFVRTFMKRYAQTASEKNLTGEIREDYFRYLVRQIHLRSLIIDPELCGHEKFLDDIFAMGNKFLSVETE